MFSGKRVLCDGTEINACIVYMCISKSEEHGSCDCMEKTARFA